MTDRVQTGLHQTNREYRWEVHPHSVHFCLHRYALAIEYKLMCEVFSFADCPADLKNRMEEREIIPVGLPVYRCPITLDPIPFELFKQELLNPRHGKSDFQIGHINPLKAETPAGEPSGNTAANMSWVTVDGNRIQGHLRLAEVRTLLQRITRNYQEVGLA